MQPSKRQARQEETKNKICEAAFHLYHQDGIEGVSMRTIGKLLGVSQMMSYRYFKSKNELIYEMRARVFRKFAGYINQLVVGKGNAESRLLKASFGYLHYSEVAAEDYRFAFLMNRQVISSIDQDHTNLFSKNQEKILDITGELIAEILDIPADSKQCKFLMRYLWISVHGLATANLDDLLFGKPNYDEIKSQYTKKLLSGIIEPSILAKLRKPTNYPEIESLISYSDKFS